MQLTPMFTPYVGTSPGTTTFGCPPVAGVSGLGVCRPGHYGPAIMLPGSAPPPQPLAGRFGKITHYSPYGTESRLAGTGIRWDLLALTFGIGFAGVLGFALYKRRK